MTSLLYMFLSNETESIHPQFSIKIYCHRLCVLLVLKLFLVIGLKIVPINACLHLL